MAVSWKLKLDWGIQFSDLLLLIFSSNSAIRKPKWAVAKYCRH
jgi:hypothetical protein